MNISELVGLIVSFAAEVANTLGCSDEELRDEFARQLNLESGAKQALEEFEREVDRL